MKINYYYKPSTVNRQIYMQIWKKENGKDKYVMSLGSAAGCLKLVNEVKQSAQTKDFKENQTKEYEDVLC